MRRQIRAGTGCVHAARRGSLTPGEAPGRDRDKSFGVDLDNIGWGAAGVARALDRLNCPERRHAHLYGAARARLSERLQQVAHGHGEGGAIGRTGEHLEHGIPPRPIIDACATHASDTTPPR